jgi:hypothetical protein
MPLRPVTRIALFFTLSRLCTEELQGTQLVCTGWEKFQTQHVEIMLSVDFLGPLRHILGQDTFLVNSFQWIFYPIIDRR